MVRQIFERCAGGEGLKGIAKRLNAAGARTPRAQQGRRNGWAPSSVREVLHRSLYRGEIVWNRTKKRDGWGQKRRRDRPEADWLSVRIESLRIVPEALWRAAQARVVEDLGSRYGADIDTALVRDRAADPRGEPRGADGREP